MREYYKLHPKHLPPPEVMEQWQRPPLSLSEMRAREARDGKPDPLIFHLQNGGTLGPAEVELLIELLEAKRGKRYRDTLHDAEQSLIARHLESMVGDGMKQEAAIAEVSKARGRKRRYILKAKADNKRRGGLI
jgi:hypothetical protein